MKSKKNNPLQNIADFSVKLIKDKNLERGKFYKLSKSFNINEHTFDNFFIIDAKDDCIVTFRELDRNMLCMVYHKRKKKVVGIDFLVSDMTKLNLGIEEGIGYVG